MLEQVRPRSQTVCLWVFAVFFPAVIMLALALVRRTSLYVPEGAQASILVAWTLYGTCVWLLLGDATRRSLRQPATAKYRWLMLVPGVLLTAALFYGTPRNDSTSVLLWCLALLAASSVWTGAACEELVFRLLLPASLIGSAPRGVGTAHPRSTVRALVLSQVAFALAHLPVDALAGRPLTGSGMLFGMVARTSGGLLLASAMLASRGIVAPTALHAAYNLRSSGLLET